MSLKNVFLFCTILSKYKNELGTNKETSEGLYPELKIKFLGILKNHGLDRLKVKKL